MSANELPVVAWCELTDNGSIGYFDGKPIVMCGPVGNDCHPVALTTLAAASARIAALEAECEGLRKALHRIADGYNGTPSLPALAALADAALSKQEGA